MLHISILFAKLSIRVEKLCCPGQLKRGRVSSEDPSWLPHEPTPEPENPSSKVLWHVHLPGTNLGLLYLCVYKDYKVFLTFSGHSKEYSTGGDE